jgi:Flp pilus assembly pilin Flp
MLGFVKRLARETGGQDVIEYALLAAMVGVLLASTAAALGVDVGSVYGRVGEVTRTAADSGDPAAPTAASPSPDLGDATPGYGHPGHGNPSHGNPGNGKPVGDPGDGNPGNGDPRRPPP